MRVQQLIEIIPFFFGDFSRIVFRVYYPRSFYDRAFVGGYFIVK
jgi:hypothetical protein